MSSTGVSSVRISRRTLAWGECDPAGIIFYPNYYRFMDEATWAMFAWAGYDPARMRAYLLESSMIASLQRSEQAEGVQA